MKIKLPIKAVAVKVKKITSIEGPVFVFTEYDIQDADGETIYRCSESDSANLLADALNEYLSKPENALKYES
jgi:hypothetical protein